MKIGQPPDDLREKVEAITISADKILNPDRRPGEPPEFGFFMVFVNPNSPDNCGCTSNGLGLETIVYLMKGLVEGVEAGQFQERH